MAIYLERSFSVVAWLTGFLCDVPSGMDKYSSVMEYYEMSCEQGITQDLIVEKALERHWRYDFLRISARNNSFSVLFETSFVKE